MFQRKCIVLWVLTTAGAALTLAGGARINLEWRPLEQTVGVGAPVRIGLYAVCNPGETQLFRAADVVFAWDPNCLQFLGIDNTGAVPLLSSTLPANDPYHLNGPTVPPTDGDGYYLAWAHLGNPLIITDQGSLLTTFRFTALTPTPATLVTIPPFGGNPVLNTRVFGGQEAGQIVTGSLGTASVSIRVCGNNDFDSDGDVDLHDLAAFQLCYTGPGVPASPACACVFDTDNDGDLDSIDFANLISSVTGPL